MYKIKKITGVIYLNVNQSFTFTKKIMFQFYYPIGVNNSFFLIHILKKNYDSKLKYHLSISQLRKIIILEHTSMIDNTNIFFFYIRN